MEELIPIVLFLSVAAVLILRPLTKRIGIVIEQMARDRRADRVDDAQLARLRAEIEHLTKRLDLVEERADFTERLVGSSQRVRAAVPDMIGTGATGAVAWDERQTSFVRR